MSKINGPKQYKFSLRWKLRNVAMCPIPMLLCNVSWVILWMLRADTKPTGGFLDVPRCNIKRYVSIGVGYIPKGIKRHKKFFTRTGLCKG